MDIPVGIHHTEIEDVPEIEVLMIVEIILIETEDPVHLIVGIITMIVGEAEVLEEVEVLEDKIFNFIEIKKKLRN
jgi:hypothetical protein